MASERGTKLTRIAVYRILGNDLPGRHAEGSQQKALNFILNNEPKLLDAVKYFILNRIVDKSTEDEYKRMILDHGHIPLSIPFGKEALKGLSPEALFLYTSGVNAARNRFLKIALDGNYDAAFPLDGRSIFTAGDWESVYVDLQTQPLAPYYVVAQARVTYEDWNAPLKQMDFWEKTVTNGYDRMFIREYALGFGKTHDLQFDENIPYGSCDKAELLTSLGVEGEWEKWVGQDRREKTEHYGKAVKCGQVRILPSGNSIFDEGDFSVNRTQIRREAVQELARRILLGEHA